MDEYREEEHLGKLYDGRLMRRLLGYARPHLGWILLSILMLLLVTAADLAGPLLIRTAIDHHLRAADRPRIALSPAAMERLPARLRREAVAFEGRFFLREDRLPADFLPPAQRAAARYQVLAAADGQHYLVLVGDEPVTAPASQLRVSSRHGATVLVVTHRPAILSEADRLLVMGNGRIERDGAPAKILADVRHAHAAPARTPSSSPAALAEAATPSSST